MEGCKADRLVDGRREGRLRWRAMAVEVCNM